MADDQIKVTHDNNGRFYRIKMDLAKEGSEIWDLTPYFKGRVGDNRFGLQVVWTCQGRLLDTTGMKPYIEGNVGNYSFDDKKDLQLAPDAATVRYTGNPSDCQSGGRATYYFPEQMFPRDGIFKGYIGLLDDRDDSSQPHISGVTVWFRVLPGIAQMGHACDVYISDLDKALQNFKVKLDQHDKDYQTQLQQVIDDARNAYESETKNAHDAAIAAQAEIEAVRKNNNNLADTIQSILNNIKANNIVTRPEYDELSTEIVKRLSQINITPNYYTNYDDMVAHNPSGTGNLCVTSDTGHKWLFINGNWLDLGEFSYADVAPIYKNLIYQPNPDNLVLNSDFKLEKNLDFTDLYGWSLSDNATATIHPEWGINGSNCLNVVGNAHPEEHLALISNPIPLGTHNVVSVGCEWNGLVVNDNGNQARLELMWLDGSQQQITPNTSFPQAQTENAFHKICFENIIAPTNARYVSFVISFDGGAQFNLCRPQINFGDELVPYKKGEINKKNQAELYKSQNDNLLLNPNFWNGLENWQVSGTNAQVHPEWSPNGAYALELNGAGTLTSSLVNVANKLALSFSVNKNVFTADKNNQAHILICFFDANSKNIEQKDINLSPTYNEFDCLKIENLVVPQNAVNVQIVFQLTGSAHILLNQPQLNIGPSAAPYTTANILNYANLENLAPNFAFKRSNYDNLHTITGWELKYNEYFNDLNPATMTIHPEWGINGFNCLNIICDGTHDENHNELISDFVPYNREKVSYGWQYNGLLVDNDKNSVFIGIAFYDENQNLLSTDEHQMYQTDNRFYFVKFENVSVPSQTAFVRLIIKLNGKAQLNLCSPQLNQGEKLIDNLESVNSDIQKLNDTKADAIDRISIQTDNSKIGDDYITAPFTLKIDNNQTSGYLQIAWQGDSSKGYPKKNFKIKLFKDEKCTEKLKIKPKSDWDKNNKFNLKANWIDATQSRNLVNAALFAKATSQTPFADNLVANNLAKTQNFGQMEGFPIKVYLNGAFQGLYTFNTKKDEVTFGMDKNVKGEEAITCEKSFSTFRDLSLKLDGTNYATVVNDTADPDLVINFQKFQEFLNQSSDTDFKANIGKYIDVKAAINCYLYGNLSHMYDFDNKSLILLTYNNGLYFYPILYDYDSTWYLKYDGASVGLNSWYDLKNPTNNAITQAQGNKLYERLYRNFKSEIVEQYKKLRANVWSNQSIINAYKSLIRSIPEPVYEQEQNLWPNIPSKEITDFAQIQQAIIERCDAMDNFMEHFTDSQPTSPAPQPTTPQTQPASGTTPATPQPTTPQAQPAKQETGETSSKPAETQA